MEINKTNKDPSTQCDTYLDSLPKLKTTATECKEASKTTSTQTNRVKFEVTTASVAVLDNNSGFISYVRVYKSKNCK